MPTSVPGHIDPFNPAAAQAGFSLLEVLIVLAIIGIITGTAGLSIRAVQAERGLQDDARRLALLFELAQAEARKTGQAVRWEFTDQGYRFTQTSRLLALPVALAERMALQPPAAQQGNPALRPRRWSGEQPVQVKVYPPGRSVFVGEWVSGPSMVELSDGLYTARVQRAGSGQYRVVP
ncbi:MAG TPA: GspH/FimT family pseudopilin [Burkholderiaceae bacterium]|nr:GspH/FimT family pseudopilin [Burkholderiaceae bacterium]